VDSLCNETFSSITQPEALEHFPFNLYELSSVGKIDLKITSCIDFAGGYSKHGRDLVEYLQNSGLFNIKLEKIRSDVNIDPFTYNYFKHLTRTEIDEDNFIEIVVGAPGQLQRLENSKAKYKIGYTMGETFKIPERFLDMCRHCNELFVPTDLDIVRFSGIKDKLKITKLPLWVDSSRYSHKIKKANLVNVPQNNFVMMFLGSWNKRKGVHEIVEAFIREFSSKESISLVMISRYATDPFNDVKRKRDKEDSEKWNILWEYEHILKETDLDKKRDKPHVCILDVPIDDLILPGFMINANVCVGASRGESTWLPGLEFGCLGVTSIQTSWGGHKDYLNEENSYPVTVLEFEKCDDELYYGISDYYTDETEMAAISVMFLQERMREAFDNMYFTHKKGIKLKGFVKKEYDKKKRLEDVKDRILQIAKELGD